jgi:hypothetical protein
MAKKYKILGISDEQTECDCCGRKGLKRTVALEVWRDGENTLEVIRVGVDCAEILSRRNGNGMSAAKIKAEATRAQLIADNEKQWKADQLQWKIENRIKATIGEADEVYQKQYPIYVAGFEPHHGKLLTNGTQFAWVASRPGTIEEQFIAYLENNNFNLYRHNDAKNTSSK